MFRLRSSLKDGISHGSIYGLLRVMLLEQEYGTILSYLVRVMYGEVNMSKV